MLEPSTIVSQLPEPAHLIVHVAVGARAATAVPLLARVKLALAFQSPMKSPAIRLRVDDLSGHGVLELEQTEPRLDIPLPPGTYNVTARQGDAVRRYTMTLAAAKTHDLHLRLPGL